jgi:hypothetical protein
MGHDTRKTQRSSILALLIAAKGLWVPLPDILELRISQFGARLYELRHYLHLNIENRTETVDGVRHSWYRLNPGTTNSMASAPNIPLSNQQVSDHLFPDMTERHRDDG